MKMKKMIAMIAAGVLCLGLSTTALAADSPEFHGFTSDGGYVQSNDKLDPNVKEQAEALEDLVKEGKVEEIIGSQYEIPKGAQVIVMGASDYQYYDADGNPAEIPAGGVDVNFAIKDTKDTVGLKEGDTVYVLHYKDGNWEVIEGTVHYINGQRFITAHMNSLSPVAFVKVMSNGDVVKLDPVTKKPVEAPKKASPKTGEF